MRKKKKALGIVARSACGAFISTENTTAAWKNVTCKSCKKKRGIA